MDGNQYQHTLEFLVRDYECDLQGIVNNANYQHYLEHARHQFLLDSGLDFAALFEQGVLLNVVKVELEYKLPLRSKDRFEVRSRAIAEGVRIIFQQDIYRLPDNKPVLLGRITGVALKNGRPMRPGMLPELDKLLVVSPE